MIKCCKRHPKIAVIPSGTHLYSKSSPWTMLVFTHAKPKTGLVSLKRTSTSLL
ncbi:hypothetical protein GCK32_022438 [Trichostrongylus colubriformis]|uniref:Uncharacterized protein n=1 Tax=Trichostrongylus colubriformis TaxID=6319 RepID=A0AAN8GEI0_TRICO